MLTHCVYLTKVTIIQIKNWAAFKTRITNTFTKQLVAKEERSVPLKVPHFFTPLQMKAFWNNFCKCRAWCPFPALASPGGCVLACFPKLDLEGTHSLIQIFSLRASDKASGKVRGWSHSDGSVNYFLYYFGDCYFAHKPSYRFGVEYF